MDDITASDPRVAQILAMIQAKVGPQAPIGNTDASAPQQQIAPIAPPPPPPQMGIPPVAQQVAPPDAGPPPSMQPAPAMTPPQAPQLPPPPDPDVTQQSKPGPVKSFLMSLGAHLASGVQGGQQALLAHAGLPTAYDKQQNAAKLQIQQQAANDTSAYRQAQTGGLQAKADELDRRNTAYTPDADDQSVLPQFRGKPTTIGQYQNLQGITAALQGKQSVADTAAGAKTDVATIGANSKERLANAQMAVRQAIADRNYGLAAQRLSLAGGSQNLRQLEYRMRAYGTGADGQPLPGVEFDANGLPVGTAAQANVRPTTNARNAGERAETMQDLATRIQGALRDPAIASQLGPLTGRINDLKGQAGVLDGPVAELRNDLVSYGAFQAGLHPVRGIGGLQYFDKVMGGLGQTPEELLGKISSNTATAGSVINVAHHGTNSPPAPQGNVAPEGTVVHMPNGSIQVKRGGQWVPQ